MGEHQGLQHLGEHGAAIGEHEDLVAHVHALGPGVDDEGVVDADARDRVHAARLDLVRLVHKARQVLQAARRRERARYRQDHHLRSRACRPPVTSPVLKPPGTARVATLKSSACSPLSQALCCP